MPKDPLEKIRRLRQTDEIWEATGRRAHTWITPDHEEPYRPFFVFVADAIGRVVRNKLETARPAPDRMLDHVLQAMQHPMLGAGWPRRPQAVHLDNAEYVAALSPRLNEIGVRCEYRRALPMADEFIAELEKRMNKGELVPGLLSIPGVTPPLVGHLFELAAEFYEAAPWDWLNDMHPFEIRYPPDGSSRYAVVMGSGGEVFGLAVYDSLDDVQQMFSNRSGRDLTDQVSWFVMFLEEPIAMSHFDLDALETFGWPVAGRRAYPVFARTAPRSQLILPTKSDVFWMEGALLAILAYVRHGARTRRPSPRRSRATLTVPTISGQAEVFVRVPAFTPKKSRFVQ